MNPRRLPTLGDETGLRYARDIVDRLAERGWHLALEEARYRIDWDLHYLECVRRRAIIETGIETGTKP
jgi:hypothetical protein